jgi:hypothetical protein
MPAATENSAMTNTPAPLDKAALPALFAGRGRWSVDAAIAIALALAAALAVARGSLDLVAPLIRGQNWDLWFDADCPRAYTTIIEPRGVHLRPGAHPLFKLLTWPPAFALQKVLKMSPIDAVRAEQAAIGALCAALFYAILRCGRWSRLDGVLLTALAALSASAVFWFAVPGPGPPGLATILLALLLAARTGSGPARVLWDVLANLATSSCTITNWMAGIAATFARHSRRTAAVIVALAACSIVILLNIQHALFPSVPVWELSYDERRYLLSGESGGPARVLVSFFCHSVIMPAPCVIELDGKPALSVQKAAPGSGGTWPLVSTAIWLGLLATGWRELLAHHTARPLARVLLATLTGQLLLHLAYGRETFLYAVHFGPLLVLVAGHALTSRWRRSALVATTLLLGLAAANNLRHFDKARSVVLSVAAQKEAAPAALRPAPPSFCAVPCPGLVSRQQVHKWVNIERIDRTVTVHVPVHDIAVGVSRLVAARIGQSQGERIDVESINRAVAVHVAGRDARMGREVILNKI